VAKTILIVIGAKGPSNIRLTCAARSAKRIGAVYAQNERSESHKP